MSQEEAEKKDELVDTGEGSTAESEVADTDATAENSWPEDDGLTDSGLLLKQEQEPRCRRCTRSRSPRTPRACCSARRA